MKKKKILLMGYYGFDNIGDEAVLEAIVHQLHQNAPDCEISALSNKPIDTAAVYSINAVDRWKPFRLLRAVMRCDVFVAGGGSLLQDITGTKSIKYYLYLMRLAQLLGKKVFYYAQGVGPINDQKNRKLAALILNKCSYITVRDGDSKQFLQELGVNKKQVFVSCDPVLSMQPSVQAQLLPRGLKMGFAVRECAGLNIEVLACVADYFADKGWTMVFLPFCSPNDTAVSKMICAKMHNKGFIMDNILLPHDMMAAINACNFVVGIRLHALIMAAACAVPFAALSYDPKIEGFCREFGLEIAAEANESDAQNIIAGIEKALNERTANRKLLLAKQEHWQNLAAANALLLRECAHGNRDAVLEQFLKKKQEG